MSSRGLILDYALPGLLAIGVGLITYTLTGGEEEFSNKNEDIGEDEEENASVEDGNCRLAIDETLSECGDLGIESYGATTQNLVGDMKTLSATVTELDLRIKDLQGYSAEKTDQVLSKLQVIAEELADIRKQLPNLSLSKGTCDESKNFTLDNLQKGVNNAIYCFCCGLSDDSTIESLENLDPVEINTTSLRPACDMLLMFLKNLANHPDVPRYRRIVTNNSNYKAILSSKPSHGRVLTSLGFKFDKTSQNWDWEWHETTTDNKTKPLPKIAKKVLDYGIEQLSLVREGKYSYRGREEKEEKGSVLETKSQSEIPSSIEDDPAKLKEVNNPSPQEMTASVTSVTRTIEDDRSSISSALTFDKILEQVNNSNATK